MTVWSAINAQPTGQVPRNDRSSPQAFLAFRGSIPQEDVAEMQQSIQSGCESNFVDSLDTTNAAEITRQG